MAISLKHAFASPKADSADTSLIQPSNWNAEHVLTLSSGVLVGRSSSGTGNAEEITLGTGLSLVGGVLTLTGGGGGGGGGSGATGTSSSTANTLVLRDENASFAAHSVNLDYLGLSTTDFVNFNATLTQSTGAVSVTLTANAHLSTPLASQGAYWVGCGALIDGDVQPTSSSDYIAGYAYHLKKTSTDPVLRVMGLYVEEADYAADPEINETLGVMVEDMWSGTETAAFASDINNLTGAFTGLTVSPDGFTATFYPTNYEKFHPDQTVHVWSPTGDFVSAIASVTGVNRTDHTVTVQNLPGWVTSATATGKITATGRLNLRSTGTAPNYMAGALSIGNIAYQQISETDPLLKLNTSWNGVGQDYDLISANANDTNSAATSKLLRLQSSGADKFTVRKDGVTSLGNASANADAALYIKLGDNSTSFGSATTHRAVGIVQESWFGGASVTSVYGIFNRGNVGPGSTLASFWGVKTELGSVSEGSTIASLVGFSSSNTSAANAYKAFYSDNTSVTGAIDIESVSRTSNVVTITTPSDHDLRVGQKVTVRSSEPGVNRYNSAVTITSVPSTTTFTYLYNGPDISTVSATGYVYKQQQFAFYAEGTANSYFGGRVGIGFGANELLEPTTPMLDVGDYWLDASVAYTGLRVNVVDGGSSAASKLLDLSVGGTPVFSIRKDGALGQNATDFDAFAQDYLNRGGSTDSFTQTALARFSLPLDSKGADFTSGIVVDGNITSTDASWTHVYGFHHQINKTNADEVQAVGGFAVDLREVTEQGSIQYLNGLYVDDLWAGRRNRAIWTNVAKSILAVTSVTVGATYTTLTVASGDIGLARENADIIIRSEIANLSGESSIQSISGTEITIMTPSGVEVQTGTSVTETVITVANNHNLYLNGNAPNVLAGKTTVGPYISSTLGFAETDAALTVVAGVTESYGTAYTGLRLFGTSTGSHPDSLLIDGVVTGVRKFAVSADGVIANGTIDASQVTGLADAISNAVTGASASIANTIVQRDANASFAANTVTANTAIINGHLGLGTSDFENFVQAESGFTANMRLALPIDAKSADWAAAGVLQDGEIVGNDRTDTVGFHNLFKKTNSDYNNFVAGFSAETLEMGNNPNINILVDYYAGNAYHGSQNNAFRAGVIKEQVSVGSAVTSGTETTLNVSRTTYFVPGQPVVMRGTISGGGSVEWTGTIKSMTANTVVIDRNSGVADGTVNFSSATVYNTGNFNLWIGGNAPNFLRGNLLISNNDPSDIHHPNSPSLRIERPWSYADEAAISIATTGSGGSADNRLIDASQDGTRVFSVRKDGVITDGTIDAGQVTGLSEAIAAAGGSGGALAFRSVTADSSVTTDDQFIAADGTLTLTLPTAIGNTGRVFIVKNVGTGAVTITGTSAQTIDGQTSMVLTGQYSALNLVSNGSDWYIY